VKYFLLITHALLFFIPNPLAHGEGALNGLMLIDILRIKPEMN